MSPGNQGVFQLMKKETQKNKLVVVNNWFEGLKRLAPTGKD